MSPSSSARMIFAIVQPIMDGEHRDRHPLLPKLSISQRAGKYRVNRFPGFMVPPGGGACRHELQRHGQQRVSGASGDQDRALADAPRKLCRPPLSELNMSELKDELDPPFE